MGVLVNMAIGLLILAVAAAIFYMLYKAINGDKKESK